MSSTIAVIGAGPAGLACAYTLLQLGYGVDIFELDDKVGGMSRTLEVLGQRADLGPHHFLSSCSLVHDFWQTPQASHRGQQYAHSRVNNETEVAVAWEFLSLHRLTRIFYQGKFFEYPLHGFDALFKLGLLESTRCVLSYIYASLCPRSGATFEAWVSNAFGYRLYEIFFKTYSEKLLGIKCTELSDTFAKERIKTLNLGKAIKQALLPSRKPDHVPRSLSNQFFYPFLGAGAVYERVAQEIERMGGRFFFKQRVTGIVTEHQVVKGIKTQAMPRGLGNVSTNEYLFEGCTEEQFRPYETVVSSAVFSDMVASLTELDPQERVLAQELRYRNTLLVYLTVDPDKAQLSPDHWLYIHSPEIATGRICDNANWSVQMLQGQHEHLLCFEYWANDDDELWQLSSDKLIAQASEDAVRTGFISREAITAGFVHRIFKSYPIYHNGYEQVLGKLTAQLDTIKNLYFIGRNGSFKYNNMDGAVLMGILCAYKIAGYYSKSLWQINADSDMGALEQTLFREVNAERH